MVGTTGMASLDRISMRKKTWADVLGEPRFGTPFLSAKSSGRFSGWIPGRDSRTLLAIFSLVRCLSILLAPFLNDTFLFHNVGFRDVFYLDFRLRETGKACRWLFLVVMGPFTQQFSILMTFNSWIYFLCVNHALDFISKYLPSDLKS